MNPNCCVTNDPDHGDVWTCTYCFQHAGHVVLGYERSIEPGVRVDIWECVSENGLRVTVSHVRGDNPSFCSESEATRLNLIRSAIERDEAG
jgi:hypothetical protein